MKPLTLKTKLVLFLAAFLLILSVQEQNAQLALNGILGLAACAAFDAVAAWIRTKKLLLSESALITGLIIALVLSAQTPWWQIVLCAGLAIASKHLIRPGGRHVFNPAAAGIFLTALLFHQATQWHGAYTWYLIIPFGGYFVWKIKKTEAVYAYGAAYLLICAIQFFAAKTPFFDQIVYANYFFILIMLIEPKTSPAGRWAKVRYGILVCVVSAVLYGMKFPYDADIPALLIGNMVFALTRNKGGA